MEGPIVAWRRPILATTKYAAASASARANQRSVVNAVLGEFVMGRGKDSLLRDAEEAPGEGVPFAPPPRCCVDTRLVLVCRGPRLTHPLNEGGDPLSSHTATRDLAWASDRLIGS